MSSSTLKLRLQYPHRLPRENRPPSRTTAINAHRPTQRFVLFRSETPPLISAPPYSRKPPSRNRPLALAPALLRNAPLRFETPPSVVSVYFGTNKLITLHRTYYVASFPGPRASKSFYSLGGLGTRLHITCGDCPRSAYFRTLPQLDSLYFFAFMPSVLGNISSKVAKTLDCGSKKGSPNAPLRFETPPSVVSVYFGTNKLITLHRTYYVASFPGPRASKSFYSLGGLGTRLHITCGDCPRSAYFRTLPQLDSLYFFAFMPSVLGNISSKVAKTLDCGSKKGSPNVPRR